MTIRILGLLGFLFGIGLIYTFATQDHTALKNMSEAYARGQAVGQLICLIIGIAFVLYGIIWMIKGYGKVSHGNKIPDSSVNSKFNKIGGWLILLGISMVLFTVFHFIALFGIHDMIISTPGWNTFINSVSISNAVMPVEMSLHFLLVLFLFYLNYLFFQKKLLFREFYFVVIVYGYLVNFFDVFVANTISSYANSAPEPYLNNALVSIIWLLYVIYSKRVKYTFVN